ncbi:hypothetical protein STCU_02444 [Strigomonas culicis]|uniref:Uncharacterized protein n=1 Tax=Strigomonas culicis TaxID=28005 RepID=S9WB33_9TRYP|nr:hypothetical protein STCU_02444 [Strigomonas culicis]|eukprot:EPY33185.1 hypothetical protein STCU_02444 [Strigomonas culicis]
MRRMRRERLVHGPSRVNLAQDRHRIRSVRQFQLNQFILRESKAATVSRQDHHVMLRQLLAAAYFADPERRAHRAQWRQIVVAVRKEYWGANAILSLSPDPYHTVLAKLSSMMLWNPSHRRWDYTYSDDTLTKRRLRQEEVLAQLKSTGKLFLSE